jgi:hypothetical protein
MADEAPKVTAAMSEVRPLANTGSGNSIAGVSVGGEVFTPPRPGQVAYSLTAMEFALLKRGGEQSSDHNLGYACGGIAVGTAVNILGLLCSVSFEIGGKANWWAIGSLILSLVIMFTTGGIAAHCFIRARKTRADDVYMKVVGAIEAVVDPKPVPPAGDHKPPSAEAAKKP